MSDFAATFAGRFGSPRIAQERLDGRGCSSGCSQPPNKISRISARAFCEPGSSCRRLSCLQVEPRGANPGHEAGCHGAKVGFSADRQAMRGRRGHACLACRRPAGAPPTGCPQRSGLGRERSILRRRSSSGGVWVALRNFPTRIPTGTESRSHRRRNRNMFALSAHHGWSGPGVTGMHRDACRYSAMVR